MADVSITAANVLKGTTNTVENGISGATITAGQTVYKKMSDGRFYHADCYATSVAANDEIKVVYGIALNSAAANQALQVQRTGDITIGGAVVAGTMYYLASSNVGAAGGIAPLADLAATDWIVVVGIATSTSVIHMLLYDSNVQVPA
jgi:hypothetical protein